MIGTRVVGIVAILASLGVSTCSPGPTRDREDHPPRPATSSVSLRAPLVAGEPAWVSVSVATLWRSPSAPRSVDAPALAAPARIGAWLEAMTLDQRRELNGRADTQVLLGDRVLVLGLRPGWAQVAVPDQPSPEDARGYPGWVPRRQLTAARPASTGTVATVVSRLAWLRTDDDLAQRAVRISFGTRLPVVGRSGRFVRVATPTGAVRRIGASQVVVHDAGSPALAPGRSSFVATARTFLGVDYLWAGRSGFGLDCSGLTSLTYRVHGVVLPRDAGPQSRSGRAVTTPRRGDLLFFATAGTVHHVAMYAGAGAMIHSPHTGSTVQLTPTDDPAYAGEHSGTRRVWH